MVRIKTLALAATTVAIALLLGYRMQYGGPQPPVPIDLAEAELSDVALTSSANFAPRAPAAVTPVEDAALDPETQSPEPLRAQAGTDCALALDAVPGAGATVALTIDAPCHAGARVTVYHLGLVVTETVGDDGTLEIAIPALAETAVFLVEFADGTGGSVATEVNSVPFYDRVVLQWRGDAGLELHALEFGAEYFDDGHVWSGATGDLAATARGEGGFLSALGDPDQPDARLAEVYSFPAGTAQQAGEIRLSVEAQVSETNCGRDIEAQTLQRAAGGEIVARTLGLRLPDCGNAGSFLVLKNLVEDLTIAAR